MASTCTIPTASCPVSDTYMPFASKERDFVAQPQNASAARAAAAMIVICFFIVSPPSRQW